MKELIEFCNVKNISYKENHIIRYDTYFKRGGNVKLLILPSEVNQLSEVISKANELKEKYKLIGFSSNLLLLDTVEYGIFISTKSVTCIKDSPSRMDVSAGYSLCELVRLMLIKGVSGYEGLEGIPGSVGGAVVMNAGAYGYDVSDKIIDITFIDANGQVRTESKEYFKFKFRSSIFKTKTEFCILSVGFDTEKEKDLSKDEIARKIEVFHIARHLYQEFAYPNLGSMFSTRQDMYKEILRHGIGQKILYWSLKLLTKNPLVKKINRKKPTNKMFNNLVLRFYNINYPLSHKSVNILINNGDVKDVDVLNHMKIMKGLYDDSTHIENELCIENAIYIPDEISSIIRDDF